MSNKLVTLKKRYKSGLKFVADVFFSSLLNANKFMLKKIEQKHLRTNICSNLIGYFHALD
jgi:hypothetical protein